MHAGVLRDLASIQTAGASYVAFRLFHVQVDVQHTFPSCTIPSRVSA